MILDRLEVGPKELEQRTGWALRPEGACKGDRCVPLPESSTGMLDVSVLADRLGMALVHDSDHSLWALGPESGGRALLSADMPPLTLPDKDGNPFSLSSLRGSKVLLLAWASW
jgi:hypothetical protein